MHPETSLIIINTINHHPPNFFNHRDQFIIISLYKPISSTYDGFVVPPKRSSTRKTITSSIASTNSTDFKAAALAVTKLYQNSARQIDHARQEGYLSAVQEVAALLSEGELAGDRLREWCAVGLSRITAQQDEENRTRPSQRTESTEDTLIDETTEGVDSSC